MGLLGYSEVAAVAPPASTAKAGTARKRTHHMAGPPSSTCLLRLDTDVFHQLRPFRALGTYERAELLGGHRIRLEALIRETFAYLRLSDRPLHCGAKARLE